MTATKERYPLVSILVPAYNAERYLRETLDSAFAQTYPSIEVVVIDDGSRDRTLEILKSYKEKRLRYVSRENRGIAKTRNELLRESRGELLAFLDSDDIYLPEKVAREAGFLVAHPDYDAVYCDLRYFFDGEPEKLFRHRYTFHSGDIFTELLKRQFITNTTLMIRRSVIDRIGPFSETAREVEDWSYFLRMARVGMKFGFIAEDLVRFRLRWDNNTRFEKQLAIQSDALDIFEELKRDMTQPERERYRLDDIIFGHKTKVFLLRWANGRKRDACRLLAEARPGALWKIFVIPVCGAVFLVPSAVLRFFLEKAWNLKKRGLFVPVK